MDQKSDYVALFISVLLHSLLIFFPWPEKPRPLAESPTSTGPISIIFDESQLSASEFQPLPSDRPTDQPTPDVASEVDLPPAIPISEASDSPIDQPVPEAVPKADLTPAAPIPETIDSPTEQLLPGVTPETDLTLEDPIPETRDRPIDQPVPEVTPETDLTPEAPIPETRDRPIDQPVPDVVPEIDLPPEAPISETNDDPIDQPAPEADLPPEALTLETRDDPIAQPTLEAGLTPAVSTPETIDSPIDQPVSDSDPDSNLTPAVPIPETIDSSIDGGQIVADWENLVGYLEDQDEGFGFTLFEIFDLFGKTGQANQFFDENEQPKLDVSSFSHFPEQTPTQVLQTVVIPELTSNTSFELQPQENISAGLAYQLSQGEMLRYLIIARLNENSGSVLMLSDSLSGLESPKP